MAQEEETAFSFACIVCDERAGAVGFALPVCGHISLCTRCYLSNTRLFGNNACPICKVPQQHVILATNAGRPHSDYQTNRIPYSKKLRVHCVNNELKKMAESFLAFACSQCDFRATKMSELRGHTVKEHKLDMCNTCVRRRKVFPRDQRLYDERALKRHQKRGDPPTDMEAGIPVHVRCGLCNDWFFDDDDLLVHRPQAHVMCQVCRRQGREEWLKDDPKLLQHYRNEHIVCTEPDCTLDGLENVFINEIDFQAHILKAHSSGRDRRQARLVNLDIRYQPDRSDNLSFEVSSPPIPPHSQGNANPRPNNTEAYPSLTGAEPRESVSWDFHGDPAAQNKQLMAALRCTLGEVGLQQFRSISAAYRDDQYTAEEYYRHFCDLFVSTSAPVSLIWMSLVGLLPDFNKRTELYEVHHRAVRAGRRFDQGQQHSEEKESERKVSATGDERRQRSKKSQRRQKAEAEAEAAAVTTTNGPPPVPGNADEEQQPCGFASQAETASEEIRAVDIVEAFQAWATALALLLSQKSAGVTLQADDLRLNEADERALQMWVQTASLQDMLRMDILDRMRFDSVSRATIAEHIQRAMSSYTGDKHSLQKDEGLQSALSSCTPRELFLLRKYARTVVARAASLADAQSQSDSAAEAAGIVAADKSKEEEAQQESQQTARRKPKRKEKQLVMKIGL